MIRTALADLESLQSAGFHGVLIENEYDRPHRLKATPEVIATMTAVASRVTEAAERCVTGCEILLNDPEASLAVARAAGGHFIRTDYFVDPMVREEYGDMEIDPAGLLSRRNDTGADDILILADIQVKYATMRIERSLEDSARLARNAGADAIIVTGDRSGDAPEPESLVRVKEAVGDFPVLIGSGCSTGNAAVLLPLCDGAIIGTSLMNHGRIDPNRARRLAGIAFECDGPPP